MLVGGSSRETWSPPKCLPSQRSSQSRARTTRWGRAGSEWSGCAQPSPWLVPHTPRTWKVPEQRYSAQLKGWPSTKPLLIHSFSHYLQSISSLNLSDSIMFIKWIKCPLLGSLSLVLEAYLCIKIVNSKIHSTHVI